MIKTIAVHNGIFHCDEILACSLLKILPQYKDAEIIRTRDPKLIKKADVVIDVGDIYDYSKMRFDHHQKDFKLTMKDLNSNLNFNIRLSSAGLIYHHFGKEILKILINNDKDKSDYKQKIDAIYRNVYENFILEIDGIDNGIEICENPKYRIKTSISNKIKLKNYNWNENYTEINIYNRFIELLSYMKNEFCDIVYYYDKVWWPAKNYVLKAIEKRFETESSGKIIEFEGRLPPWIEFLFLIEEELKIKEAIQICIFQNDNHFRIQSVPTKVGSFNTRCPLLTKYQGLREENILHLYNEKDIIFVHNNGFIGETRTREAAFKLAKESIENNLKK